MTFIETLNQEIDLLMIEEKKLITEAQKVETKTDATEATPEDINTFIALYNKSLGIRFSIDRLKKIVDKFKK